MQIGARIIAVVAVVVFLFVDIPGLDDAATRMFGIFIAAVVLWVTEAIPLYATAVLVIMLEVLLISDQAVLPLSDSAPPEATTFFGALANPVIILFLGGFMLADGAAKLNVDKALSAVLLRPFLRSPRLLVLGIMMITALISFFMSNTAATATMLAVVMPVVLSMPKGKGRTGVVLAVPVAANVGGIATPVGSPPNAIALGALQNIGEQVTFLEWMIATIPIMIVILAVCWAFLAFRFVPRDIAISIDSSARFSRSNKAITFYVVALSTIILWLSEPLHGLPATTVGFLPVVGLLVLGVMHGDDIKALEWPVLWLVAGGLALGSGFSQTGLADWMIGGVNWAAIPIGLLFLVLAVIAWGMSNFLSSSAAANIVIPMAVSMVATVDVSSASVVVAVAVACSLGVLLPISTPPNAIAYATGEVATSDLVKVGLVLAATGITLLAFVAPWLWGVLGVL